MNRTATERGTTLIEMILYIAIVSILLSGVGVISMSAIDAKAKAKAVSDVFSGATFAMGSIERMVGRASTIVTPLSGTSSSTLETISTATGTPHEKIEIANGALFLTTGTGTPIAQTAPDVRVDNATFTRVGTAATTTGVRITLFFSASTTGVWRAFQYSENFTTTVLLGKNR